jgi:MFS transporter, DHA2 family, multidrug resistance protein
MKAKLLLLALPGLLVTMDLTVLFLAVPKLTASLAPSSTELLWITDIYGFLIAGALIVSGALGDRLGRRRVMVLGAAGFAGASLLASAAPDPSVLIVARALQGLAGAALLPSMMALVFAMFPDEKERTAALGVMMGTFALGAALGPLFGGALLELFGWRAVFLPNLPVMAVLIVLAPRVLPEFRNPTAARVDLLSGGLSVLGVLGVIYGIKAGARDGLSDATVAVLIAGAVLLVAFVARQRRLADPLIDLDLFRRAPFTTALLATAAAMFVTYGTFWFTAQHLQLVAGLSALEAGLWGLPPTAAMMIVAGGILPRVGARVRPATLVSSGMLVAACGLLLITTVDAGTPVPVLVLGLVLTMVGLAPTTTMGINLIVGAAPPEHAGTVSGLGQAGNELGGALGIALLGTLGMAVYRDDLAGGSLDAITTTPGGAAFAHGMHVAAGAGAALLLVVAMTVALVLRRLPAAREAVADAAAPATAPVTA